MAETLRRIPFPYRSEQERFRKAFSQSLQAHRDKKLAEFMPPENAQAYRHGTRWRSDASSRPDEVSEFERHEHTLSLKWDDIIALDLSILKRHFLSLSEQMHGTIMQMMYAKISEAAGSVGNTISLQRAGSHAAALIDLLQKIEFGVDRHGNPSLPQIHASPEMVDTFLKELRSQGPDFEARVQVIIDSKTSLARERERERRSKFCNRDDPPCDF